MKLYLKIIEEYRPLTKHKFTKKQVIPSPLVLKALEQLINSYLGQITINHVDRPPLRFCILLLIFDIFGLEKDAFRGP